MISAISRVGTPSPPTAWNTEPADPFSRARRYRRAASNRCTAGQRLEPSPMYADAPLSRARPIRTGTNPWSPSPWTEAPGRTIDDRTPRVANALAIGSAPPRGGGGGGGGEGVAWVGDVVR